MLHVACPAGFLHSLRIRLSWLVLLVAGLSLPLSASAQATFTGASKIVSQGYNQPTGVAVDAAGNVYVIVFGGNQQLKETLQLDGTYVESVLPSPASGAHFPSNIAVDSLGNVYIADTLSNSVYQLTPSGSTYTAATLTLNASVSPTAIAVDAAGNLYVASEASNSVYLETPAGGGVYTQSTIVSGLGGGPYGIAVDSLGNVYIADTGDSQLLMETPSSGSYAQTTIGSGLLNPAGVTVDGSGNVYIADSGHNRILKETLSAGVYTQTSIGSGFSDPQQLALDNNGNLYIANDQGGTILELHVANVPFGAQAIGSSTNLVLNFTIASGTTVGSVGILTTGVSGKDFTDAGSSTCTAQTYSSATSCVVNVNFSPLAAGLRRGAVTLYDGSGNVLSSVPVYGNGTGPQIAFEPGIRSFVSSGFSQPVEVAVDSADNVYVSDAATKAVYKVTPAGLRTTVASGFQLPAGVAVDGAGNVYISDKNAGTVSVAPQSGTLTVLATGLSSPDGIAVDGQGNVYIANTSPAAVYKIASNGAQTTVGGGFSGPTGLAIDSSGNLYITDQNGNNTGTVYKISSTGVQTTYDTDFLQPDGIAINAAGEVFVVDSFRSAVIEVLNGTYVNNLANGFCAPMGIAAGDTGNVFVADSCAHNVVKFDLGDPPSVSFANTTVTYTSTDSPMTFNVLDIGNRALDVSGISFATDFPEGSGNSHLCATSFTLAPGQGCDLSIDFSPLSSGSLSESITLTDNALNVSGAMQTVGVSGTGLAQVVTRFSVAGTSPETAGTPFTIFVTALDASNHTVAGYTGTVHFSSTDALAALPADATLSSGIGSFIVTLNTAGAQTIFATDTVNSSAAGSAGFQVNPGPASRFAITAPSSAYVGGSVGFTVTAFDGESNVAAGYAGTVQFTSTDPSAALPAPATLTAGTGTFSAMFMTTGSQTITATDSVMSTIVGTSNAVSVTIPNLVLTTANDDTGTAANCTPQTTSGTGTDSACSLRDALAFAAANGSASITFDSGTFAPGNSSGQNTITLSNGSLSVPANTSILGPTTGSGSTLANLVTVNGNNSATVFTVASGVTSASISNLIIANGSGSFGGGVNNAGTLTVSGSTFSANSTNNGGGAIYTSGAMTVANSTFTGNISMLSGGAIENAGIMNVSNSTFSGNQASNFGGAIFNHGTASVTVSTISGNTASSLGGGGIYNTNTLTLANSIVAGNSGADYADVEGNYTDNGGNQAGIDPSGTSTIAINLAPLGNYGGPTQAMLPLPGSPAICGGTAANLGSLTTDQRGLALDADCPSGAVDSGAVQSNYVLAFSTEPPASVNVNQAISPAPAVQLTENGAAAAAATGTVTMTDSATLLGGTTYASLASGVAPFGSLNIGSVTSTDMLTATLALNSGVNITAVSTAVSAVRQTPSITWNTPAAITYGTALDSTQLNATASIAGTYIYTPAAGAILGAGPQTLSVTFTPNDTNDYTTATSSVQLTVNQATPSITWPTPSTITYGTALGSTQLNASSPVAGSFVYSPASGAVLSAGSHTLGVTFTPNDTTDYTTATGNVQLVVNQATPSITWPQPAPIPYGTALSGTQLNASSAVAGSFVYTPDAGAVLVPGSQTLSVTFTPTDATDYSTANASVNITVDQKAFITLPANGSVLSGANVTFSWSAGGGVTQYELWLGTTGLGSSNIFNSGAIAGTSVNYTAVPTNGVNLYARLWSRINGSWQAADYTFTEAGTPSQATLTSPAAGSVIPGANVTFSWTPGSGPTQYELWLSGAGIGQSDVFNSGALTATSVNVPVVPANGVRIYARLWSQINGIWQSTDYTYTESGTLVLAALTSPAPGSQLPGSSASFSWTQGTGPTQYELWLSSVGAGQSELYNSGAVTGTSASVSGLPTNGVKIYARLWSKINGVWQSIDYTYTEFGTASQAALTSPTPSSTLPGANVNFSWTPGTGPTQYELWLSSVGSGQSELYNSGAIAATSASVSGLPTIGVKIYATLWSRINNVWQSTGYTYTEFGSTTPAALTLPTPGGTLPGANVNFSWTPGTGPTQYELWLSGVGAGQSELYNSGAITTTSASVSGLPTNGVKIYATLWSRINNTWQSASYTYTEFGTPTPAALTSPTPGSQLPGDNVTFSWSTGAGPTQYELWLGTTGVGSADLYNSGSLASSTTSASVNGLPTNGVLIYVRLWSQINGKWQAADYTVTEFGTASQAVLTSPTPGSQLPGANVTFSWTSGTGPVAYELWLGSTGIGSSNLFNSGSIPTTSASPTGLPTDGSTIYARLWSRINNAWQATDYKFTAQ